MLTDHMTPGDDIENTVYFYGDGEPQTPRRLIERLAAFDRTMGLEPDNYSLGGTIATAGAAVRRHVRQRSGDLSAQRGRWRTTSPSGPCVVASRGPWSRNKAICTMTPVIV